MDGRGRFVVVLAYGECEKERLVESERAYSNHYGRNFRNEHDDVDGSKGFSSRCERQLHFHCSHCLMEDVARQDAELAFQNDETIGNQVLRCVSTSVT